MPEYDFSNSERLRKVVTVYESKTALQFQGNGRVCLRRDISKNPEFVRKRLKVKNRTTGEMADVPEERVVVIQYTFDQVRYPEDEWIQIEEYDDYPREKPKGVSVGYYLLPSNPLIGERLFIPKLIEDVYVTKHWDDIYLAGSGVAVWNGNDLELGSRLIKLDPQPDRRQFDHRQEIS